MSNDSRYSLSRWAEFLGVSLSGYHDWRRSSSLRYRAMDALKQRIKELFDGSRSTYGVGRICGILRGEGVRCSYEKVKRLMLGMGLKSIHLKRRSRSLTDSRKARDDSYINHAKGLEVDRPLKLITSDISYIRTKEGFVYLCAVRDAFTGVVLSHTCSERMTKELVLSAINGVSLPKGAVFHSDRGSQYTSTAVMELLRNRGVLQSFSRVGKPGDNAWAESFFSILKKESVHWRTFTTRNEARLAMFDYIEGFYNTRRVQKRLGYRSPMQFLRLLEILNYKRVA